MVLQEKVQELANADGASSGDGQGAWDFALTTDGSMLGIDGLALGVGYGEEKLDRQLILTQVMTMSI